MYVTIHAPQKDKKSKYVPYISKTFQKTVMRSLPNRINATRQKDKFCCWLYKGESWLQKRRKLFRALDLFSIIDIKSLGKAILQFFSDAKYDGTIFDGQKESEEIGICFSITLEI